jgi:hypothetical protein
MKSKRNDFIQAKLLVDGEITAEEYALPFGLSVATAAVQLKNFAIANPNLSQRVVGENKWVKPTLKGKAKPKYDISVKDAEFLLEAVEDLVDCLNPDVEVTRETLRFAYAEAKLIENKKLGRDDIARAFELAGAAATRTMQAYNAQVPGNVELEDRRYHVMTKDFKPMFLVKREAAEIMISAMEDIVGEDALYSSDRKLWHKERNRTPHPKRAAAAKGLKVTKGIRKPVVAR